MNDESLVVNSVAVAGQTGQRPEEANYDAANIAGIRNAWKARKASGAMPSQAYTLVQTNAPCEVEITEESRKACAEALLSW